MANLKFLRGLSTSWASLGVKDKDTFYVVEHQDTGGTTQKYELYLGDKLIADGSTLEELAKLTQRVNEIDEVTSKAINKINLSCGFDEEVTYNPKNELISGATSLAEAIEIVAEKSCSLDSLNATVASETENLVSVTVTQTNGKLTKVSVDDAKLDSSLSTITSNINAISGKADANTAAIEVLNGEGVGSVKKTVNDAVSTAKTEIIGGASIDYNTLGKLENKIKEVSNQSQTYKITQVTGDTLSGLGSNVKEAYQLSDKDGVQCGEYIKIYKDSSLQSVELQESTGETGELIHELVFTYILNNGETSVVPINISTFLAESEFKDGLQVNNGVVSIKKDDASEDFLTVSPSGIKISGVQDAIDAKISSLDATVASTGGSFVTVTVTETDGKVSNVKVEETNIAKASDVTALTSRVDKLEAKTISAKTDSNIEVTQSGDTTSIGLVWGTF